MQELHDQSLANLQATEAEKTFILLEQFRNCAAFVSNRERFGDVVVPAHKAHAFFRALPDEKHESLKAVLPL